MTFSLSTATGRIIAAGASGIIAAGIISGLVIQFLPPPLIGFAAFVPLLAALVVAVVAGACSAFIALRHSRDLHDLKSALLTIAKGQDAHTVSVASSDPDIAALAEAVSTAGAAAARLRDGIAELDAEKKRVIADLDQEFDTLADKIGRSIEGVSGGRFDGLAETDFTNPSAKKIAAQFKKLMGMMDQGVSDTLRVVSAISRGETDRIDWDQGGVRGQLRDELNNLADKMAKTVSSLTATSASLKETTGEIMSGANDLSDRTTKQAATIEETSAQMEQISVTVMENAKRANEARKSAAHASDVAREGGMVMADATSAMDRITESASRISEIIGMIDDIAFQTNLLALNASVEAARAGEAGKGFAVVAAEVRRLAQSAAQASQEVKHLVLSSDREVKSGAELVVRAADNLGAIVDSVTSVTILMDEIAGQSREQANSLEEVSDAVRTMDRMTQHNAALVQQTNAAIARTRSHFVAMDELFHALRGTGRIMAEVDARSDVRRQQVAVNHASEAALPAAVGSDFAPAPQPEGGPVSAAADTVSALRQQAIEEYQKDPVWQEF